jgi:hypothetical protein
METSNKNQADSDSKEELESIIDELAGSLEAGRILSNEELKRVIKKGKADHFKGKENRPVHII